jgi:pimeloyl-ACP methyl ester carboxylesterase
MHRPACHPVSCRCLVAAEYPGKASFLLGESMGGAVCLLIHRREPEAWHGAVLLAPMCKVRHRNDPVSRGGLGDTEMMHAWEPGLNERAQPMLERLTFGKQFLPVVKERLLLGGRCKSCPLPNVLNSLCELLILDLRLTFPLLS